MVVVDTSVWVEYFKSKPSIDTQALDRLILEAEVSICLAIYAEIFSGQMTAAAKVELRSLFVVMNFFDLDWNKKEIWQSLGDLADSAFQNRIPACGLVDRMIVQVCKTHKLTLWTLDTKLKSLSHFNHVQCFAS